jgi:hypothetical protein
MLWVGRSTMNPPVDMTGAQPTGGIHPADLPRLCDGRVGGRRQCRDGRGFKRRIVWSIQPLAG